MWMYSSMTQKEQVKDWVMLSLFLKFFFWSRNGLAQLADNSHGHGFLKTPRKIVYNWRNSLILIQRFCNSVTTVNTCLVKATAVHSTWCLFLKFCAPCDKDSNKPEKKLLLWQKTRKFKTMEESFISRKRHNRHTHEFLSSHLEYNHTTHYNKIHILSQEV